MAPERRGGWFELSQEVKLAAGWCCQRCGRAHGEILETGKTVFLTVIQKDGNLANWASDNLEACCVDCAPSPATGSPHHAPPSRTTRERSSQQAPFFFGISDSELPAEAAPGATRAPWKRKR